MEGNGLPSYGPDYPEVMTVRWLTRKIEKMGDGMAWRMGLLHQIRMLWAATMVSQGSMAAAVAAAKESLVGWRAHSWNSMHVPHWAMYMASGLTSSRSYASLFGVRAMPAASYDRNLLPLIASEVMRALLLESCPCVSLKRDCGWSRLVWVDLVSEEWQSWSNSADLVLFHLVCLELLHDVPVLVQRRQRTSRAGHLRCSFSSLALPGSLEGAHLV